MKRRVAQARGSRRQRPEADGAQHRCSSNGTRFNRVAGRSGDAVRGISRSAHQQGAGLPRSLGSSAAALASWHTGCSSTWGGAVRFEFCKAGGPVVPFLKSPPNPRRRAWGSAHVERTRDTGQATVPGRLPQPVCPCELPCDLSLLSGSNPREARPEGGSSDVATSPPPMGRSGGPVFFHGAAVLAALLTPSAARPSFPRRPLLIGDLLVRLRVGS